MRKLIVLTLVTLTILVVCHFQGSFYDKSKQNSNHTENREIDFSNLDTGLIKNVELEQCKNTDYLIEFTTRNLDKSGRVFISEGGMEDDERVYLLTDTGQIYNRHLLSKSYQNYFVGFIWGLNRCEYSFPTIDSVNKIFESVVK